MAVSEKDVHYIAQLARIHLSEQDTQNFTAQLDSILEYIHTLNKVDTQNIQPTAHILPVQNVFREDTSRHNENAQMAVEQAPALDDNLYQVPPVIE